MRRYLKKIAIVFVIVIALLAVSGGAVVYFFEDEVVRFVIENVNKQVNSDIKVQSAHFSVFRRFPNASVEFRHVEMSPAKGFDTLSFDAQYSRKLLEAGSVFVELNLVRLLRKDFRITKIMVQDGRINMLTDQDNHHNYIFWKTAGTPDSAKSTPIELQNVTLRNVDVYYSHRRSATIISLYTRKARLHGRFTSRQYSLGTDWDGTVQHFSVDGDTFIKHKGLELSGRLAVDENIFSILECSFALEKMRMNVSGGFSVGDVVDLNLHVNGNQLDYASLVSVVPEQYAKQLRDYPGKGVLNFSTDITGTAGSNRKPRVEAEFSMANGLITHSQSKINLSDLFFSGSFTTGAKNERATTVLQIQSFGCRIGNNPIKGTLSIQDFRRPLVTLKINGRADLEQLYGFIPLKQVLSASGQADASLTLNARMKGLSLNKASDIDQLDVEGSLVLTNAAIRLSNRPYRFTRMNGTLQFDKYVSTKNLSFELNSNDFSVNGRVERFFPYLLGRSKTMYFDADVASGNLCVDSLLLTNKTPTTVAGNSSSESPLLLPDEVVFDANLSVENFRYRKFVASGLKGRLTYKPRVLAVHSVTFTTMSGNVSGSGTVANDAADNIRLLGETTMQKIDIGQLFQTFDNFSQDVIRAEHLKGALSGELSFAVGWDNRMRLQKNSIEVESSLELAGGELTGFEPMKNLSRFVALDELQNIRFSTLRTKVFVKEGQITLPVTDIESSAFKLSGSGVHNFNNTYTYHVKVLLSELLAAKARKNKSENQEHEYMEDGGKRTAIFMKVVGEGENFKISYDKQSAKASVATDIRKEKQTLKGILKEEFGWFKNDSSAVAPAATKTGKLRFNFDEDEEKTQQGTESGKSAKKGKKKKEQEEKIDVEWE